MSLTRYALTRYKALDRCLRSKNRIYDYTRLKKAVDEALRNEYGPNAPEISRRQLYYDLQYLQSETGYDLHIEQERVGRKVIYYYADEEQSIFKSPITREELEQIASTLSIMSRIGGHAQADWMRNLMLKLRNEQWIQQQPDEIQYILLESNEYYTGQEWIENLFHHCVQKHVLTIRYKPFQRKEESLVIHPYFLKAHNMRWFLFGWSDQFNRIINLALDRIVGVEICLQEAFKAEHRVDPYEYFEDMIGVTRYDSSEVLKIEAALHPDIFPYFKTKPLHGSQKVIGQRDDGWYLLQWELLINPELKQKILMYGDKVEIISPEILRNDIKTVVQSLAKLYSK